ncbi:MAG: DEAD/DEAH box helicase [bacterium]
MDPAITIRNLPRKINHKVLESILTYNAIPWKRIVRLDPDPNDTDLSAALILLKDGRALDTALRRLGECEVAGQILSCEASEWAEPPRTRRPDTVLETDSIPAVCSAPPPGSAYPEDDILSPGLEDDESEGEGEGEEAEENEEPVPFSALGLSPGIQQNIANMGFETATPIQALLIPPAMEGCDLIGRAQTGTGKTLAFTIPIAERLLARPGKGIRALVLAPTRELAIQIKEVMEAVIQNTGLKTVVLYGGESILDQMISLREEVNIIIATPGRLLDLQGRGRLRFDASEIFVLDEADRMLDMGFLPQISNVFHCFYEHPQVLLLSATVPRELQRMTMLNLKNPVFIDAGAPDLTPLEAVTQKVLYVTNEEKQRCLFDLLNHEKGTVLVFTRTKRATERLAQRLKAAGYNATRIHGDISQSDRLRALDAFREGRCRILVATDVASRGLDIEGIAHVVNYDLPMAPEDHLHRIGRTARAGAKGKATTFITHEERRRSFKEFKTVLGQA